MGEATCRKTRQCDSCKQDINPGETMISSMDGYVFHWMHKCCAEAELTGGTNDQ